MTKSSRTRPTTNRSPITNRPKAKAYPASNSPSSRTWMIAILIVVVFSAAVAYLDHSKKDNPTAFIHRALHHTKHDIINSKTPDFEFYTALPSGKLTVMADNAIYQQKSPTITAATAPRNPPPLPTTLATNNKTTASSANKVNALRINSEANTINYFLQVGSFPDYADADELKAQLLLANFNANTQKTVIQGKKWYRVLIGPFHNITNLNDAQSQLNKLHYPSIRLQLENAST